MAITWVTDSIGYGDITACTVAKTKEWAVVHACKDPCHRTCVGYTDKSLAKDHPAYLSIEQGHHLYLNLIDPPVPLFQDQSFVQFFDFIDRHLGQRPIVIHCNKGESRAPSLTLLVMAKRLAMLPDNDYASARQHFEKDFPYKPGGGISQFLAQNWARLGLR